MQLPEKYKEKFYVSSEGPSSGRPIVQQMMVNQQLSEREINDIFFIAN
jgi:hypothetical protein